MNSTTARSPSPLSSIYLPAAMFAALLIAMPLGVTLITPVNAAPTEQPSATPHLNTASSASRAATAISIPLRELPSTTILRELDPLTKADRHLAAIRNGLPELGGAAPAHSGYLESLSQYYATHRDPENLPIAQQELLLKLLGRDPNDASVGFP